MIIRMLALIGVLHYLIATRCLAEPQERPEPPHLAIESYRLPNGLKVVLHRDTGVPRVAVCVAYHVGSKNEKAGRTGFAHFFEHMMFRGTSQVPNYDIPLQEAGASSNAFTSEDMTVYFEVVTREFLERALYLEANRLGFLASALDQEKFDTEREVVKNERRQSYENVPYGLAEEAILASLYPAGHPYSWSVIGSMQDLNRAGLDDLKDFFATYYHPGNATLALVGDFEIDEAKRWIEHYFGPIPPGPPVQTVGQTPVPAVSRRVELTDQVTLPRIYWIWPTVPDSHPDAPALEVLANLLADGEAARLQRALVRDQQIASSIEASSETREIAGFFQIAATPTEDKTIEALEDALHKALLDLREHPPTQSELSRLLAQYQRATYSRLASALARAIQLAVGSAQYDDPEHYRKEIARTLAVTTDDLARVAHTYLVPEKLVLVIKPGSAKTSVPQAGPLETNAVSAANRAREPTASGVDWSILPGPARATAFQPPAITRKTLSNGLEVWFTPWPTLPIVSAKLAVPAGTAHDTPAQAGLAKLTATLATQGTRTQPAVAFAESLESLGTTLGMSVTPDDVAFSLSTLAPNLERSLELMKEALSEPRIDAEDCARERSLLTTELRRGPDQPPWIAQRALRALLYGRKHPYGQPEDGRIETVEKLERQDVLNFHSQHYIPQGARLIIAGSVEPERLLPMLERTIGTWGKANPKPSDRFEGAQPESAPAGVVYLVDKPEAAQSLIRVARHWVGRDDPRYFAALLGNRVLGGDFLSRLNQNLRERNGYTYGAGSSIVYRKQGGLWVAQTSVRTDVTGAALREMLNELDAVSAQGTKPLSSAEIADHRASELLSWPDGFGTPSGIIEVLDEFAAHHRPPREVETYLADMQKIPDDAIRSALAEIANPRGRIILVVGDRKTVEPQLHAAGFENIKLIDVDGAPVRLKP